MPRLTKAQKAADKARRDARIAEATAIVATGKCPQCGCGLRRNLAILGWWQCEQYGDGPYRKHQDKPQCSFQTFTD